MFSPYIFIIIAFTESFIYMRLALAGEIYICNLSRLSTSACINIRYVGSSVTDYYLYGYPIALRLIGLSYQNTLTAVMGLLFYVSKWLL